MKKNYLPFGDNNKIKCQFDECVSQFQSVQAAKKHVKIFHPSFTYTGPTKDLKPTICIHKIKCKICNVYYERKRIKSHIIKDHGNKVKENVDRRSHLHGWWQHDLNLKAFTPVFLITGQELPEHMVPKQKENDGNIMADAGNDNRKIMREEEMTRDEESRGKELMRDDNRGEIRRGNVSRELINEEESMDMDMMRMESFQISVTEMVETAIEIAAHPLHGMTLRHGVPNWGDGNCAPESANDNYNLRNEFDLFRNKTFETPHELRQAVVDNMISNKEAFQFAGYQCLERWAIDMENLKQSGEWSADVADLMMPGIAYTLDKNILIFNTKPQEISKEPISLIQPEIFGGKSNTDIPLLLAYDGSHFEGMLPGSSKDRERSEELVRLIKRNDYTVKVRDIKFLKDKVNPEKSKNNNGDHVNPAIADAQNNILPNIIDDPYHDENDDPDFTSKRVRNMTNRYRNRNIILSDISNIDLPGNKEIMEDFKKYLEQRSTATLATGEATSQVPKYVGHIFHYPDSYLEHLISKNKEFRAAENFCFGKTTFKLLSDPFEWIRSGEGLKVSASRRRERMKAHAAYREYMRNCLDIDKDMFGGHLNGIMMMSSVIQDLDRMERKIRNSGFWDKLGKLETQNRVAKESAIKTINPKEESNLRNAISNWNKSEVRMQKMAEIEKTYDNSLNGIRPSGAQFNALVQMTKFECHNLNRDRNSAYKFTNGDYISKRVSYVPKSIDGEDNDRLYSKIPLGWNTNAPPSTVPEMKPSGWVLEVLGDVPGMKGQKATVVSFTPRMKELCERYRTVRDIFFEVR